MGYGLSIVSMLGIVALAGIVINDSLILINHANGLKDKDGTLSAWEIIHAAGIQRFRPIVLTTLTTFGGLTPMIFETSRQAKMLIPMAISLGFGILFATFITLILVPSIYLVLNDMRGLLTPKEKTESALE
jgi:multidrug efflux pump subunit AcrB